MPHFTRAGLYFGWVSSVSWLFGSSASHITGERSTEDMKSLCVKKTAFLPWLRCICWINRFWKMLPIYWLWAKLESSTDITPQIKRTGYKSGGGKKTLWFWKKRRKQKQIMWFRAYLTSIIHTMSEQQLTNCYSQPFLQISAPDHLY